jgi:malonyl-CoA O-methyltransferase
MTDAAAPRSTRRAVDDAALARIRRRLAAAPQPPWLHAEAARRMAERLAILRRAPQRVLDWYGDDAGALRAACPTATLTAVDPGDVPLPPAVRPWWRRWRSAPARTPAAQLAPGAADLLWANMGLHWRADPLAEMRRWHAALAVDGVLMFTTLGPGSLAALRRAHAAQGWGPPMAALVDMHDLGDMLVEAGFADPVMDQEVLTLSWADAGAMLAELRGWGGNADPARFAGLRTPRWRAALQAQLAAGADRPALEVELVYGHAIRPVPRVRVQARTEVGVDELRSILRHRPGY